MDEKKRKSLELALKKIEKDFGKSALFTASSKPLPDVKVISTQCPSLDFEVIQVGGVPRGRITEIVGPESSGKTTFCLHLIAECQRQGGIAAMCDAENAVDLEYARKLGVNADELLLSQPDNGEQGLSIVGALIESGAVDLVIVDSVAGLTPRAEIEGDYGDSHVGLQARMMTQALRKMSKIVEKSNVSLVFTNQLREKIGVMFGSKETTPGGRALRFYASVRLDMRRVESIKDSSGEFCGIKTRVKAVKNKVAPPFREAIVEIHFGKGFSSEASLLDLCEKHGLMRQAGAWWYLEEQGEDVKFQGKARAIQWLEENPNIYEEYYRKLESIYSPQLSAESDDLEVDSNE